MTSLLRAWHRPIAVATAGAAVAGLILVAPAASAHAARGLGPPDTWVPAGPMRFAQSGQTATLLPSGKVLVAGGGTARAELYNPATRTFSATGRMPIVVTGATATLLHDGKVLVAGGLSGGQPTVNSELYDPATGTWAATGSLREPRALYTATLLPDGQVLAAGGRCYREILSTCLPGDYADGLNSAELYNPATGRWTPTGSMHTGRSLHSATLLRDGDVLVAGGQNYCTDGVCVDTKSAELYHPATGKWTVTGSMHQVREQHSATLLANGEVLVAGGEDVSGNTPGISAETHAELYDPRTGTWTRTASMIVPHVGQTATLLRNGWVLVAGGNFAAAPSAVAEIYEPQRAVWVLPGAMVTARISQTATVLPDGHVLVTGGTSRDGTPLRTAEEFLAEPGPLVSITPTSIAFAGQQVGTISSTRTYRVTNEGSADLVTSGAAPTGRNPSDYRTVTNCGKAPVAPGGTCTVSVRFGPTFTGLRTATAALYDNAPLTPQTVALTGYGGGPDTWIPVGSMAVARDDFSAVLLPSGKVLVAGGEGPGQFIPPLADAELYNPATRSFAETGSLHTARSSAAATLLPGGQVLIAGGFGPNGALASAELYDPATGKWTNTTPMHAAGYGITGTLLPSGKVLVVGLGFGHSAEVYDPATRTWTDTGPMKSPQWYATVTVLHDGKVLAVGGRTAAAELYNPATNRWAATASLQVYQESPTATLLPDGEVLVAGGSSRGVNGVALTTSELYNPATGSWSRTKSSMRAARAGATATLLSDGTVLEAGGCTAECGSGGNGGSLSSTEDWSSPRWTRDTSMTQPRSYATATELPDGTVLVAGGDSRGLGGRLSTAELFMPILMSMRPGHGPADTRVTVSGSGFYAHEHVRLVWNYGNLLARPLTTASGTFTTTVTIPDVPPGSYPVTATGERSANTNEQAFETFTVTG
jgi:large repetitive protein